MIFLERSNISNDVLFGNKNEKRENYFVKKHGREKKVFPLVGLRLNV